MLPKVLDSGIPEGTSSSLTMPEEAKRGHRQSNAPVQLQDERDKGSHENQTIYKMLYRPFIHTFECACFPENFQIHALLFPMVSLELPTSTPSFSESEHGHLACS